jgi:hypothetical protein
VLFLPNEYVNGSGVNSLWSADAIAGEQSSAVATSPPEIIDAVILDRVIDRTLTTKGRSVCAVGPAGAGGW